MNKHIANILTQPKRRRKNVPVSLRTTRDELNYAKTKQVKRRKTLLDDPRLREWEHWALIENEFPYTAVFKVHHLLIPKRIVDKDNLTDEESEELMLILDKMNEEYDCLLVNYEKKQSIRNHFHVHLLIYKDNRKDIKL